MTQNLIPGSSQYSKIPQWLATVFIATVSIPINSKACPCKYT